MDRRADSFRMGRSMTEDNKVVTVYEAPFPNDEGEFVYQTKMGVYDSYTGKRRALIDFLGSDPEPERYVVRGNELICFSISTDTKQMLALTTYDLNTGERIRTTPFEDEGEWNYLDGFNVHVCLGREEDVYVCTPKGIYGGKLDQDKLNLLMTADELGYGTEDEIRFFGVGWEEDFYLLYGTDAYGARGKVQANLHHFMLE